MSTQNSQRNTSTSGRERDDPGRSGRSRRRESPARPEPKRRTSAEIHLETKIDMVKKRLDRKIGEGKTKAEKDMLEARSRKKSRSPVISRRESPMEVLGAAEKDKAKWEKRQGRLNKVKKGDPLYNTEIVALMAEISLEELEAQKPCFDGQREKREELLRKKKSGKLSAEENKRLEKLTKEIKSLEDDKAYLKTVSSWGTVE